MKLILTIDVPERDGIDSAGLAGILDHSSLQECLETALHAEVSLSAEVVPE